MSDPQDLDSQTELVYGAPEFGHFRLVERRAGRHFIAAKESNTWGAFARSQGFSWRDFVAQHMEQLLAWQDEWNYGDPFTSRSSLNVELRIEVFEQLVGKSPDAVAAVEIDHALRTRPKARAELKAFVEFGRGAPGAAFDAILLPADEEFIKRFEQILLAHGCRAFRFVRDDKFVRRVFQ